MTQVTTGPKKLLLIDANSLIHRFFHAMPPLTTPKGEPIGAIYGLAQVLLRFHREFQSASAQGSGVTMPTHIAAAFDRPEPTFRDEMFKEYKAQRPTTPNELITQLQRAHDLFDHFKIKTFEIPGFEADDIIGTLATKFGAEPDMRVEIFSGDLDTLQLVSGDTIVAQFLIKGVTETVVYNEAAVVAKYGIPPKQLPEYKGFVGDSSDNIPGVKGVGPKTALPLIQQYGTVENIFDHISELTPPIQKKLDGQRDVAILARDLVTIHCNAPIYFDSSDDLRWAPIDMAELMKYFEELGFHSLTKRVEQQRLM